MKSPEIDRSVISKEVFAGGGEMGSLMRAFDWSRTPLGPVSSWPQSLKTAVRIILTSRYAMFVWWGEELVNLYNDPYRVFLGKKHPAALGQSAQTVWSEIWGQIGPRTDAVLRRGEATFDESLLLLMDRFDYLEETYFTFSYSPLPDDQGEVRGIFCAVTEVTQQIVGARRLALLREVATKVSPCRTPEQVCQAAAGCMASANLDLPFASLYLDDSSGKRLRLAAQTGIDAGSAACPEIVDLDAEGNSGWPFRNAMGATEPVLVNDIASRFPELPTGGWSKPPERAILFPIPQQGQLKPAGVLLAGLNPHREFDADFRGFLGLLVNQIASGIGNAVAHEEARRRADALADIDREKTLFFTNISHEFRTPLTLMLGPLEAAILQARVHPSEQNPEQLALVHRNALRLLKLVNTLLDFSRIEARRLQAVHEPTDLAAVTAELASVFRSAMEKAGLEFRVQCDPLPEPVYVDRDMWEKIVLNLLSNAFKFTFEGEVSVTLKAVDGEVQLSVSDTGGGIPQHEVPRVFERFHRVKGAKGRTFEGTGIGLSLVQELAKLHNGSVRVVSALGKGSTFTVSIPRGKAHLTHDQLDRIRTESLTALRADSYVQEALQWLPQASGGSIDLPAATVPIKKDAPSKPARELILLADDNGDMRGYLRRLLSESYDVHAVSSGEEALAATRELRPNLVLADIMMSGLDGFGILQAIRNDPSIRMTPVILLSARAGEESTVEGLQAGADDYLVKPFTARELVARVSAHLNLARIRRGVAERESQLAAIVESSDDAIVSKDLNGIIQSWNASASRMFGYAPKEIIGQSILMLIPQELHSEEVGIMAKLTAGQRIDHYETQRLRKDGQRVDVSLTISPVRDALGRVVGASKIARDISERRKTEEALRTAEKLASVGRMAATMAHEINNPLEAVVNLLYLAANHPSLPEGPRQYLRAADEELARVAHITRQTLGFYRESATAQATRISQIFDGLLLVYGTKIRNKNLHVDIAVPEGMEVTVFRGELRQVLANLLQNSIEAARTGGHIRIRATKRHRRSKGEDAVQITIADDGKGIPEAGRSRIFEPFFTTKKDIGTGLGLWVCKGIVERHGGSIRVRSRTDEGSSGTVFSIFLPVTGSAFQDLASESALENAV